MFTGFSRHNGAQGREDKIKRLKRVYAVLSGIKH